MSAQAGPVRNAVTLLAVLTALPALAESGGAARVWVGSGFDSNARRDFVRPGGEVQAEPDGVMSVLGSLDGFLRGEALSTRGSYDLGVRKFLQLPTEDVLIQAVQADAAIAAGNAWLLGVDGHAKDRRGADRDYSDLAGQAYVDVSFSERGGLKLALAAHRFAYWNRFAYSFSAPELSLAARYRVTRMHGVALYAEAGRRKYNADANTNPTVTDEPPRGRRFDTVLVAGASYTFRGPVTATLGYAYTSQRSNSFGESAQRHRVSLTAGARLPWSLALLGQAAVQVSSYPDGVWLSSELNIAEDEESHNTLSLKLVRPLAEHLDVELKYALYQDRLPQNQLTYFRQQAWLGVSWRL